MKLYILVLIAVVQKSYQKPATAVACNGAICCNPFRRVCGTDLHLYQNECALKRQALLLEHEDLRVLKYDTCLQPSSGGLVPVYPSGTVLDQEESEPVPEASVFETTLRWEAAPATLLVCDTYSPVCGTDDVTYANQCVLDSVARETGNQELRVAEFGPCEVTTEGTVTEGTTEATTSGQEETVTVTEVKVPRFVSTCVGSECCVSHENDVVCGTDGKQYPSECVLKAFAEVFENEDLQVRNHGPCPSSSLPDSQTYRFQPTFL